jgi:hypothetical protein
VASATEHRRSADRERWRRKRLERPWGIALAVAFPVAAAYLALAPSAGDLAAATYRSDLFARVGFTTWDTGWYAAHGHWLPAYSLLSPALGALLGVRLLLALSAIAASVLFALIAARVFDLAAARLAAGWFALGVGVSLLSGRVPYDLGFAIGLGAVLASIDGRWILALVLAVLTSVASPVAGAFLALAAVAGGLGVVLSKKGCSTRARGLLNKTRSDDHAARARRAPLSANNNTRVSQADGAHNESAGQLDHDSLRCSALAAAAIAPILILSLAYPEGGYEPFAASAFWPALGGVVVIALLLPQGPLLARHHMAVRVGAGLYALALIAAYAIHTPMGGNAARLGPLLAGPLLAGVLWESASDGGAGVWRPRHSRALLAALAPALLYWQLATPIRDYASISGDPSVKSSYYAPVLAELQKLTDGRPTIVEVPLTKAHWEAAYLAGHDDIELARGWERQLDTRYGAIFYHPTLSPTAYRAWLAENRVRYVALPDAPLDKAGALEGASIAHGLPYLRELWHSKHWRVYRFIG